MKLKTWVTSLAISSLVLSGLTGCSASPAPEQAPTSSKSAEPTMLQLLGNPTVVAARQDFLAQLAKSSARSANLEYLIDPLFNSSLKHEVMVDTQVSAAFWANIRPADQKVKIYIAPTNNMQFIYKNMWPTLDENGRFGNWLQVKMNRAKTEKGFFGGGAPAFDKDGNPVFMMFAPNDMSEGNGLWTSVTSHEFTHLVQRYIMHGNFAPIYGWMLEGQADYIGANIATRKSATAFASYWAQLIQFVGKNSEHPEMLKWDAAKFVTWFQQREETKAVGADYKGDIPTEDYIFGALAMQYLYGNYGFDAVTELFDGLAKLALAACPSADSKINPSCTPARHQAFENAFGISLDTFYPKVAAYIVQEIAWSKVAVTKLPSDLLKIAPAPWADTPIQETYVAPPGLGPIAEYGNPMPATTSQKSGSGSQSVKPQQDPYPPNVPAPNRTCPKSDGLQGYLYGASMTCVKGIWTLDPGQTIIQK
jgi:hypothetical protein